MMNEPKRKRTAKQSDLVPVCSACKAGLQQVDGVDGWHYQRRWECPAGCQSESVVMLNTPEWLKPRKQVCPTCKSELFATGVSGDGFAKYVCAEGHRLVQQFTGLLDVDALDRKRRGEYEAARQEESVASVGARAEWLALAVALAGNEEVVKAAFYSEVDEDDSEKLDAAADWIESIASNICARADKRFAVKEVIDDNND